MTQTKRERQIKSWKREKRREGKEAVENVEKEADQKEEEVLF